MPNTNPLTITAETMADKVKRAHHRMHCDFAFFIGGTRENTHLLPELELLPGCAGVKVFMGSSTGSLLLEDEEGLRQVLKVIRRRASFHAEDEARLRERKSLQREGDPTSHPEWRDHRDEWQDHDQPDAGPYHEIIGPDRRHDLDRWGVY
jgi:dihydroorotase